MKTLLSLFTLASLLMGQFSSPTRSTQAHFSDATAVLSESVTETPTAKLTATPAESPTEPPTPSATATVPAAEEETPTSTLTETAVATETPSPTSTLPVIEKVTATATGTPATPVLSLSLSPDFITNQGKATIHWEISGLTAEPEDITLQFTFPKGVLPEIPEDAVFDETTNTLTIPVFMDRGRFEITAQEILEEAFTTAVLFDGKNKLAEAFLVLHTREQFELTAAGGEIQTRDGKIKLSIPTDTFTTDTTIEIGEPGGNAVPDYSLSGRPFEIKAKDKESKTDLHQLGRKVDIHVSYADLDIPEEKLVNLLLYWYNPETREWEALRSVADPETKTVTGTTDHFSVFDVGLNDWQAARMPSVDDFQVSKFTGAATYSLPIEVPPGPGGLQPSLALTYNSQVVDQSTTETQASWVGMGWSLETGSIEVNTGGSPHSFDDTYFLNVGGISARLVRDATDEGVFHASDENFWRFEYDSTNKHWTVWDKTGNIYYFEE